MSRRFPVLWSSILAGVLLVTGIAEWPYGYYTFLRIIVCATSTFAAYKANVVGKKGWMIVCGVIAVLFNPVLPIYLTREIWIVLDIASAILLTIAGFSIKTPKGISQPHGLSVSLPPVPQPSREYRSGDHVWEVIGDGLYVRVHYYMYRCDKCQNSFGYEEGSEHGDGADRCTCPSCGGNSVLESRRTIQRPIDEHRILWPESCDR